MKQLHGFAIGIEHGANGEGRCFLIRSCFLGSRLILSGLQAMTKFIASIVARKKLLLLLTGLWLAAATAGYFIGARDNKNDRSNTVVYHNTNIRQENAEVFLDYKCNNTDVASYDIDNHLVLNRLPEKVYGSSVSSFQEAFPYAMGVLTSAGSAVAKVFAEPAAKSFRGPKSARNWRFVANAAVGVMFAASGLYTGYAGYRINTQHLPTCDDAQILHDIRNDVFWKPLAKSIAVDLWQQANDLAHRNEISPDRWAVLKDARRKVANDKADSELFIALRDELGGRYRKLEYSVAPWTPFHFLMFTVGVFLAMLLVYFFLSVSEAPESPKKVRKSSAN
jgi:hypothetical protein